jgi:hypothetical protein
MFMQRRGPSNSWMQEEQDEHGQGKWEGEQKGPYNNARMFALFASVAIDY